MNLVVLEGRIANDLELKYSTGEKATASLTFNIAVNRNFKNAEGNYDCDFIRCVAWRSNAEFISRYFHKGDPILITGNIRVSSYTNRDGAKVYSTDVIVDKANFVVGGKSSGGNANTNTPKNNSNDFINVPDNADGEELPWVM